jgi:hypothetical protein
MVELIKIGLVVGLALLAGCAVAHQGVVRGSTSTLAGTFNVNILGRVVVADFVNFRPGLVYFRLAIVPGN